MEAKKSGWLRDAWEDTEKRHVICFVAFVLIIAIVIGAYFGIKAIVRGENTIQGSWEYKVDIASYGDLGYTMHLTSDNRIYLNSELASNYGKYTITKGGANGHFYTDIAGVVTEYDYTFSEDGDIMYLTTPGSTPKAHYRVKD